jgi:hypothetical protein
MGEIPRLNEEKLMFVIPVKYNGTPYIQELVKSIRQHHPKDLIYIVDSCSEKMTYISEIERMSHEFPDRGENISFGVANNGYVDGAIWKAYELFPEEQFFYILHDSMIVNRSLREYRKFDFTSYMWFDHEGIWDNEIQKQWVKTKLEENTTFSFKEPFTGLFGITFFCKRSVLDELYNRGLSLIRPTNKNEMCGSERMWGMCLEQIDIDIKQSSIQGDYWNRKTEDLPLTKIFAGRK